VSALEAIEDKWIKTYANSARVEKPLCVKALNHMINFHCERRLEAAVIAYITNFMNTLQNEERLKSAFMSIDKNKDGTLSVDELRDGFREYLGD
jgi:hypothetical protein